MKTVKILGLILLIAGLAVIGWTLHSSYNIFTGKTAAPEIFALPEAEDVQVKTEQITQEQLMEEQLKEIFPTELFPELLNLIAWSILAFILIFGGSQIAGIGIKLIRK